MHKPPTYMNLVLNINQTNISVNQSKETGFPVLFIHGNSLSSHYFEKQMNSDQLNDFRLISFDLPGHGKSDKAFHPEQQYCFKGLIQIVKGIIDELNLDKLVIVGHSLGGHVAIQSLERITNIVGLMVFGTPPLGIPPRFDLAFNPLPEVGLVFKPQITKPEAVNLSNVFCSSPEVSVSVAQDILSTDPEFRGYLGQSIIAGNFIDELITINDFSGSKCIILGDSDQMVNINYIEELGISGLWQYKIHMIKNAGHMLQYENVVDFNNILIDFLDDTFEKLRKKLS